MERDKLNVPFSPSLRIIVRCLTYYTNTIDMKAADELIVFLDEESINYAVKDAGKCVTIWLSMDMRRHQRTEIKSVIEEKAEEYTEYGLEDSWIRFHARFPQSPVSAKFCRERNYEQ